MESILEPLSEGHRREVMDIYNHYVENGFASFRELPLPYGAFDKFLAIAQGFPAYICKASDGKMEGFGFLHAWHTSECFTRTAEASYFLHPDAVGRGIGSLLLNRLLQEAAAQKIDRILASVSSRNPASLAFHHKHDFVECGRFSQIGKKHGQDFDVVWMIKHL